MERNFVQPAVVLLSHTSCFRSDRKLAKLAIALASSVRLRHPNWRQETHKFGEQTNKKQSLDFPLLCASIWRNFSFNNNPQHNKPMQKQWKYCAPNAQLLAIYQNFVSRRLCKTKTETKTETKTKTKTTTTLTSASTTAKNAKTTETSKTSKTSKTCKKTKKLARRQKVAHFDTTSHCVENISFPTKKNMRVCLYLDELSSCRLPQHGKRQMAVSFRFNNTYWGKEATLSCPKPLALTHLPRLLWQGKTRQASSGF